MLRNDEATVLISKFNVQSNRYTYAFDAEEFDEDRAEAFARAKEAG